MDNALLSNRKEIMSYLLKNRMRIEDADLLVYADHAVDTFRFYGIIMDSFFIFRFYPDGYLED